MTQNENHETHGDIKELMDAWHRQTEVVDRIRRAGGFKEMFAELDAETRAKMFANKDRRVGCIDEGCDECGIRVAGSGILFKPEDKARFIEILKKEGIKTVTYHDSCGAAGVASGSSDAETVLGAAKSFADEVAAGIGGEAVKLEHMSRPLDFHVASVVYYDGTGKFDPTAGAEFLAKGFVISRPLYPSAETAAAEARLSFDIAVGPHGYGKLVNEDHPFIIVVIGSPDDPEMSEEKLREEVALKFDGVSFARIESFTPPADEEEDVSQAA